MSHAAALLVVPTSNLQASANSFPLPDPRDGQAGHGSVRPESTLSSLAHDLRQPLSTIESIAYYLGIVLPPHEEKARQQVAKLQQLVQQSSAILADALAREHSGGGRP